jgi:hypothetical protein
MSQHSEERLTASSAAAPRAGARILPFERPQSELQRAVQQRAQDALDRDRELDEQKRRPQPLKWLAIFAVACIPVLLTLGAVDSFLRVFHKIAATYSAMPTPQPAAEPVPTSSEPGVVLLQSYDESAGAQRSATPSGPPVPPEQPPQ